jgi:ribonuclease-3
MDTTDRQRIEEILDHHFSDQDLLERAVTHASLVDSRLESNERLEFLGDAVIDLAVSHRLMERFPGPREGDLSKLRAAVVDEPGLAGLARTLDLGPLLRLGRGEEVRRCLSGSSK